MTGPVLNRQSELPRSVPLFRYFPDRIRFSWQDWDPALVRSVKDIPGYLILGDLDKSTFQLSPGGWSARWQGKENDTYFDVAYMSSARRWEVRQTWRGLDGGFSSYPARISLDKLICQALYMQFPNNWDRAAKLQLESVYQVTVVEQPENAYSFCGVPDGAFRTIVFPIAVSNLRPMRQWLQGVIDEYPLAYPIDVEAKLVFQALNYLEGKAPEWTAQPVTAFKHSVMETGLAPNGFPVLEKASDGSASWTLRREVYFLFISLPFAGLTDFLNRMASKSGPIRTSTDPDFRFELRPIVIPAAFEMQTESLVLWDKERTTRSFLKFDLSRETNDVSKLEDVVATEELAPATLAKVEAISSDVVTAIDQIFQRVTKGTRS